MTKSKPKTRKTTPVVILRWHEGQGWRPAGPVDITQVHEAEAWVRDQGDADELYWCVKPTGSPIRRVTKPTLAREGVPGLGARSKAEAEAAADDEAADDDEAAGDDDLVTEAIFAVLFPDTDYEPRPWPEHTCEDGRTLTVIGEADTAGSYEFACGDDPVASACVSWTDLISAASEADSGGDTTAWPGEGSA